MATFKAVVAALQKAGFEVGKPTKTKIFTLTYLTKHSKGYISIRHDPDNNMSAVIAEFFGDTKTQVKGIGGEIYMVRIVPKLDNVKFYRGLNKAKCEADFAKYGAFMLKAVAVFKAMEQL